MPWPSEPMLRGYTANHEFPVAERCGSGMRVRRLPLYKIVRL
jgi:hypothetical protein